MDFLNDAHLHLRQVSRNPRLGMGSIGKGRLVRVVAHFQLAGHHSPVWSLALWIYGYLSTQGRSIQSKYGLGNFLRFVMKFLTTFIIGLIVGIPRWRTGHVYGSLILHSLINIFGR